MDIRVTAKFMRVAPRKVRLVIDLLRGKPVTHAEQQLQFINKAASLPLLKLLRSAKANAKNNFNLDPENMYVKSITADGGPVLKRYMPKAHGSADIIRKRLTHVTLVLAEKNVPKKEKPASKKTSEKEKEKKAQKSSAAKENKPATKKNEKKKEKSDLKSKKDS